MAEDRCRLNEVFNTSPTPKRGTTQAEELTWALERYDPLDVTYSQDQEIDLKTSDRGQRALKGLAASHIRNIRFRCGTTALVRAII